MSIRNVVISVCFSLFLAGPASLFCVQRVMQLEIPSWLSSEDARYLAGGENDVNVRASMSIEGIASGRFQKNLETEIKNYIPLKAYALLGNASLQRSFISMSNMLFAWECYPTYFGSAYVWIPDQEAITGIAGKHTTAFDGNLRSFVDRLKQTAQENPSVTFVMYLVSPNDWISEFNPTYSLVANARRYDDVVSKVEGWLGEEKPANLLLLTTSYPDIESYYEHFYRSDSHWNINGTIHAYETICVSADYPMIDYGDTSLIEGQFYCGGIARNGLFYYPVQVSDTDYDFSGLTATYRDGETRNLGSHVQYENASALVRLYNFYGQYYDVSKDCVITEGKGAKNTLLIGDSFSYSLCRLIAESSSTTFYNNALYYSSKGKTGLADHLESHDVDTVLFVGNPDDYASFVTRNPDFFPSVN